MSFLLCVADTYRALSDWSLWLHRHAHRALLPFKIALLIGNDGRWAWHRRHLVRHSFLLNCNNIRELQLVIRQKTDVHMSCYNSCWASEQHGRTACDNVGQFHWSNNTEPSHNVQLNRCTTRNLDVSSQSNSVWTKWLQPTAAVALVIFSIGACGNAGVLTVLIRARPHSGSSVHFLIAKQSALELHSCLAGLGAFVMVLTHGFKHNGNRILDGAICIFFWDETLSILEMTKFMYVSGNINIKTV